MRNAFIGFVCGLGCFSIFLLVDCCEVQTTLCGAIPQQVVQGCKESSLSKPQEASY